LSSIQELLTNIFRASTDKECITAETALLSHTDRAELFSIAQSPQTYHIGLRALAARYFTQSFPDDEKVILLGNSEEVLIRAGVVVGFGELFYASVTPNGPSYGHLVPKLLPFVADTSSVVQVFVRES
jgi:hypothetical protein